MKQEIKKDRKNGKMQRGQRLLWGFVCAFIAVVIVFGIVLGIVIGVQMAGAAAEYKGVTMDKKTAAYFASYYKYNFIASLKAKDVDAYDAPDFWHSKDEDGIAYGTYLVIGAKNYIADILVSNYYYNRYASLDGNAREKINEAVDAVMSRLGDSSEATETLAVCRTDKDSLKKAAEMLYKARYAKNEIYGTGGATLMGYPEECERYLAEYSRVKLLFIRTRDTFLLDSDGKRVVGSDGAYEMRDLTTQEIADREALFAKIDSEIAGYESGANIQITEELFDGYLKAHGEGEKAKNTSGYYFSERSVYSAAFAEDVSLDIVKKSLEMDIGDYEKICTDFAVCYIYRCDVEKGAYSDTSDEGFFADFYSDAADFLFDELLENMREDVEFGEKLSEDDIVGIGYDSDIYVRF